MSCAPEENNFMLMMISEFLRITKKLNHSFDITPLLYGSLGLGKLLNKDFSPQDIDFLVPQSFIGLDWIPFQNFIESLGYSLTDLQEHEFSNGKIKIAFAPIEGLEKDLGITPEQIDRVEESGSVYKLLNLQQYLSAYEFSFRDGYRRDKNNSKDASKIECIRKALQNH